MCKLNVTSRKFTILKSPLMVILSLQSLKILLIFFFILSISRPDKLFTTTKPSSLFSPNEWCWKVSLSWFRMYVPTISHISAPSKQPIGTSRYSFPSFLTRDAFPWNNSVLLQYLLMINCNWRNQLILLQSG